MGRRIGVMIVTICAVAVLFVPGPASARNNSGLVVAVGDSFISGEGGVPYRPGTDTDTNQCHRSISSPVSLLALAPWVSAQDVSCSGATTKNVVESGRYDQSAQANRIDPRADRVVVMIGGNDIGFGGVLGCFIGQDCSKTQAPMRALAKIEKLGPQLDAAYDAIKDAAPDAKVLVLLYPRLLPPDATADLSRCPEITQGEVAAGNALQTALNNKITERAKEKDLTVVKPKGFEGHDICSDSPFFYRPGDVPVVATYHPNGSGRLALAASIALSD